jgi:arsenate reductase-like glutaredoxin family protein
MKRIYYLSTCDTCKRILSSWNTEGIALQDIKTEPMTAADVDAMIERAGSAEALFSKRARKFKELGLKDQNLSEEQMRQLIIDEYTFLKRPVLILDDQIFVGNSKKVVEAAASALQH